MSRRETTGRQIVEIKKIENPEALQVTFSKRRNGLFKKACELAILCGAEVLIIVFSPAGSPDVQSLVDRYLTGNPTHVVVDPYMGKGLLVRRLASQFMDLTTIRDKERERISNLRQFVKDFDVPNEEDLGDKELEKYVAALDNLKTKLVDHIGRLRFWEANANNYNINPPPDVCPHNNANIFTPMEAFRGEHMILPHPHNCAMGFMNFQYNHHVDQQIKILEPIDYYCTGNLQYDHVGDIAQASAAQNDLHIPGNPSGSSVDVGDYMGPGVPPFGAHQGAEWNNGVKYHGGI